MAVIGGINPHEDDLSDISSLAVIRGGITVLPHVQRFADDVEAATGESNFGTYVGHDPSAERAIDCFVEVYSVEPGTTIANFAIEHMEKYGIWYIIFRQRIYNPEIGSYWRNMEDRGSPTQNHFDHVHLSFYEDAPINHQPGPTPTPKPIPPITGDVNSMKVRYIWGPDALHQTDWVFDGPSRIFATGMTVGVLTACDKNNFPELGHVDTETHTWFQNVASQWR